MSCSQFHCKYLLEAAELLTTNKLSELACLALYLMYEKKQGKQSFWRPFIQELDRQRGRGQLAVESPLLWSSEELKYFTGSPMKEVVLERNEGIKREYEELDTVWFMAGSLFKQYPYDIPTEAFPFEIFKQAFVAVQSCVVHLQVSPCTEKAVLDQLCRYFTARLATYPTSARLTRIIYNFFALHQLADPTTDPKRRVATQLVQIEKKMLNACLAAVNEIIDRLPDLAVVPCPSPYGPILK